MVIENSSLSSVHASLGTRALSVAVLVWVWLEAVLGTVDFSKKLRPTHWWRCCKQKRDMHLCWGLNKPFIIPLLFFLSSLTPTPQLQTHHFTHTRFPTCRAGPTVWMANTDERFPSRSWMFSYFYCGTAQYVFWSSFVNSVVLAHTHKHTHKRSMLVSFMVQIPFSKAAGLDGIFSFSELVHNMHKSSVIWVKTKVLWCRTVIS